MKLLLILHKGCKEWYIQGNSKKFVLNFDMLAGEIGKLIKNGKYCGVPSMHDLYTLGTKRGPRKGNW